MYARFTGQLGSNAALTPTAYAGLIILLFCWRGSILIVSVTRKIFNLDIRTRLIVEFYVNFMTNARLASVVGTRRMCGSAGLE